GEYVYAVDAREGGGGSARAIRGKDGSAVEVADFAPLFRGKNRPRCFGRHLLVTETDAKENVVLRLYDLRARQDVWKKSCAPNALPLRAESPELTGVLEPGGAVTLVNLRTGNVVFHPDMVSADHLLMLTASPTAGLAAGTPWVGALLNSKGARRASVKASHMNLGIQDAPLLEDSDQHYPLLSNTAPSNNPAVRP